MAPSSSQQSTNQCWGQYFTLLRQALKWYRGTLIFFLRAIGLPVPTLRDFTLGRSDRPNFRRHLICTGGIKGEHDPREGELDVSQGRSGGRLESQRLIRRTTSSIRPAKTMAAMNHESPGLGNRHRVIPIAARAESRKYPFQLFGKMSASIGSFYPGGHNEGSGSGSSVAQ
jgi:hypothetical protein